MSYTQSIYHIVFRTKYGQDTIVEEHEKELYAYLYGIVKNKKSHLYRIGGMPNHIHMLVDLHPTIALSDFMKELKEKSSKWLKTQPNFPDFIGWAEGYAALSKKSSDVETVMNYIKGQKEHHKNMNSLPNIESCLRITALKSTNAISSKMSEQKNIKNKNNKQ